jgi:hypothetical protein
MKHILFGLLISLCLIGCGGLKPPTQTPSPIPATPTPAILQDDYAIYTALLPAPASESVVYAIQQATLAQPGDLVLPEGALSTLLSDTLSNFNTMNRQSHPLDTVFTGQDPRYALVNRADFYEKPSQENGLSCSWMQPECFNIARFQAAYPDAGGITLLSSIGYNPGRTQALVAVQQDFGQDRIVTQIFLLVKAAGEWQIIDHYELDLII